jgi:nucleotide-binding universal stress UspA family protein
MDSAIRSIVIGIADAGEDRHLAPAVQLAESLGATLHVVHAYRLPEPALYPYVDMSVFGPAAIEDIHRRVQGLLEEQIRTLSASDRITSRAVPVPAAMAVVDAAADVGADLIIVGATRHGTVARAVLGSTAQRVLRTASVPVLVSRRRGDTPRRVLLTTDLSELSARVHARGVQLATLLARGVEPELRTLLVVAYDVPVMAPLEPSVLTEAGERQLEEFLADTGSAARAEGRVRVGDPRREIAAEAEEWSADLLVLGTHGRSGVSRFLIGSVAESVLRNVECDTLVIPAAAVEGAARGAA